MSRPWKRLLSPECLPGKAESFTGSAKTITAKELERVGNGNLFQSLRNLDPSLNIMDNLEFGSDPNKLPNMQLRGTSTFPVESNTDLRSNYQDDPNQPLFILDGFRGQCHENFRLGYEPNPECYNPKRCCS